MKRANFVDFFGTICPILNLHRCKTYGPFLESFPPDLVQIILKYSDSREKKVIILPTITRRNRFNNWIKVGPNQWGRI